MERLSSHTTDTSWASRARAIANLALPIMGGMVSQNVLNLVDTWMVGKTGAASLAAVSAGGMVNFAFIATLLGLSAGVQTVAARRHGEQRFEQTADALNGALLLAIIFGTVLTAVFVPLVPIIFEHLNPDPAVIAVGVPYLTARTFALIPSGINVSFRGFWNGTGRPQLYMLTLLVVHSMNIVLNWVLIFGHLGFPAYGAVGAGIASAIATGAGTLTYFILGFTRARENGFLKRPPSRRVVTSIARLAMPNSIQQLLFASGFTALFWILGRLGTLETAAAGVLINVMLVAVLPGLALGITATSLVSQELGRKQPKLAARWGWDVVRVSLFVSVLLSLPMLLATRAILGSFLNDPAAVEIAVWPLRVFALSICLDSAGTVLQQALLGAGANRHVMLVSAFSQWVVFLPAAYVIGPVLGHGLFGIWSAQAGYRLLQAGVYAWMWNRGNWKRIEL